MKSFLSIVSFFLLTTTSANSFEGEFRQFKAKDGRVITGRMIDGDKRNKKIRIERKQGQKIWVPINVLSKDEIPYLQEWFATD